MLSYIEIINIGKSRCQERMEVSRKREREVKGQPRGKSGTSSSTGRGNCKEETASLDLVPLELAGGFADDL